MEIRYSKERLKSNLRIGLIFLAIGIAFILVSFITTEFRNISMASIGLGQIGAVIFMCLVHYYEINREYLTIKDGELVKNTLFPKRVKLDEIQAIHEYAGNFNLKMKAGELVIDTQIINPDSLLQLRSELQRLKVVWN